MENLVKKWDEALSVNPVTVEYHRGPTDFEINKGYGARHYLSVPIDFVRKNNGDFKAWFISPFDGLRYYK